MMFKFGVCKMQYYAIHSDLFTSIVNAAVTDKGSIRVKNKEGNRIHRDTIIKL